MCMAKAMETSSLRSLEPSAQRLDAEVLQSQSSCNGGRHNIC